MMRNDKNILSGVFFSVLFLWSVLTVYAGNQDVSAVRAMQLFDSGNYTQAEKYFRILLEDAPENPMLNYYYGASRTENGFFGERELSCLLTVGENMNPDRLHYYLGVQYHARSNWDQALKHYNMYRLSVPEDEQQEVKLAEKIQQCFDQINPFVPSATEAAGELQEDTGSAVEGDKGGQETFSETVAVASGAASDSGLMVPSAMEAADTSPVSTGTPEYDNEDHFGFERELLPDLPGVKPTYTVPSGHPIEFQIDHDITYLFSSQFQTPEGDSLFARGYSLQQEMQQLLTEADELRAQYTNISDPLEKEKTGEKILSVESRLYQLQEEINRFFAASREHENSYWEQADPVEKHNFLVKLDKIRAGLDQNTAETGSSSMSNDTVALILAEELSAWYGKDIAHPSVKKDDQLVYKIQIGAYSRGVPAYKKRLFDKLSLLRKIDQYTDEKGVVVYTTGHLSELEDALKMQAQVRQEGIKDAYVVPYFNGKRITLEQAKQMESDNDIKGN